MNQFSRVIILMMILILTGGGVIAQPVGEEAMETAGDTLGPPAPRPPTNVRVLDKPNDAGHGLIIRWNLSPDDGAGLDNVTMYEILRSSSPDSEFVSRGILPAGETSFEDSDDQSTKGGETNPDYMPVGSKWYYRVAAISDQGIKSEYSATIEGITKSNPYHKGKTPIAVAIVIFTTGLLFFISQAKKGRKLFVRPLAGIDAVDDAIGRATEMGKPILFILGLGTASDIATIAGFTILARVAKRTAEYQTRVLVPVQDPVVLAVAQETVRTAFLEAGRPDQYNADNIFYVTAMQFPYVAAVNGIMLRERPATNFYCGKFYAESLILAETGNIAGSIQISGTDEVAQLPFFVAATDYTLIGEELYAASAYLSQEPVQLGTLKAQDTTKAIVMAVILIGVLAITIGWTFVRDIVSVHL
jgi:hypothetical protein